MTNRSSPVIKKKPASYKYRRGLRFFMKNGQWFQKIIQCLIVVTGSYILYRGGGILAETGWLKQFFQSEKTVKAMQDAAVDLYFPGYSRQIQETSEDYLLRSWIKDWMPVLEAWYRQGVERQETAERMSEETEKAKTWDTELQGTESAETEQGQTEEKSEEAGQTEAKSEKAGQSEPETEQEADQPETVSEEAERPETGAEEAAGQPGAVSEEVSQDGAEEEGTETEEADQPGTETGETELQIPEQQETEEVGEAREALSFSAEQIEKLQDFDYLLNHYFVVDPDTAADATQLNAALFLEKDLSIEKNPQVPQILIYHTHSQEAFLDSVEGDVSTTIVGIGDYLTELLEEKYGYQVIHDTGVYDLVDGVLDRSAAYDYARSSMEQILEDHPTIEVVIDLHRDGVDDIHFVTEEKGKSMAKIMFFNGLSRNSQGQPVDYLYNPYIEENLAFSFQLQMAAEKYYPGFTRNIYLKGQRFNLHLRPRSLLVEAGTQLNTVEEEKNAMEALADILNEVLTPHRG